MNQEVVNKVFQGLRIAIIIVGVIMLVRLSFSEESAGSFVMFGGFLTIATAILGGLSAVASIVINPAGLKNALIGIGALLVIIGISYGMADGSDYAMYKDVDEATSKNVSLALNMFYITGLLALLSIVYSVVARIFK
ncbi:MAG: hypothetical protein SchgKO_20490 [Schleiferiaceae bacterium]|jgi:hypothetical protein